MRFHLLYIFVCITAVPLLAQDFNAVSASAQADLDQALTDLAEQRESIREVKVPLSRQLNESKSEVETLRRDADRLQRVRDSKITDLSSLEADVKLRQENLDYLRNLLGEYLRGLDSRMSVAERQVYEDELRSVGEALDNPNIADAERFAALAELVDLGLKRTEGLIGGRTFEGSALAQASRLQQGTFGLFGPITFFSGGTPESSGTVLQSTALDPRLSFVSEAQGSAVQEALRTGEGMIPIDPGLGEATAILATRDGPLERITKGGVWIFPILFFAFVSIVVALFKTMEILSVGRPRPSAINEITRLLREGKDVEAIKLARGQPEPYGQMLTEIIENREGDREFIDEIIYERMIEFQPRLNRLLPLIAVTAAISPLLGLLGTVTGIIKTFNLITIFGTGDPRTLADGISEALITTEFGLLVAIPALIVHAVLSRQAQGILSNLERVGTTVLNDLSRKVPQAT
ncbi:MAG: MotA/TolQ/ExbB proton channel family protein [Opitutales bacterium]